MSSYDIRKSKQQITRVIFDDVDSVHHRNMNTDFDGVVPVAIVDTETLNETNDSTFGGNFFGIELSDGSVVAVDGTSFRVMTAAVNKAREFGFIKDVQVRLAGDE